MLIIPAPLAITKAVVVLAIVGVGEGVEEVLAMVLVLVTPLLRTYGPFSLISGHKDQG